MRLITAYDAALFDLDGVIYLGPDAIPAAPQTLAELRRLGTRVGFVTNNAARSPGTVAEHLRQLSIEAAAHDVVTSAQASARLLAERFVPGTAILVLGTSALAAEVEAMGLRPVRSAADHPAAVLVGFDPTLTWTDLNEACHAVQSGAVWYGCNPDLTRPTERGLAIGLGAMLQAMGEALPGQEPVLAGKPYRPLLDETVRRLGTRRPIFVGDRLDTDILGANHAQMDSLFVLTGSHGPIDLLLAPPDQRPTWIAADVAGLLTAPPYDDGQVEVVDQALVPTSADADPITVLWSAARQAWAAADQGLRLDPAPVLALLETVAGDQS